MKILVVDDEKLLVKGMKFNLENEGYEVATAYDGASAVELAKKGDIDLIVMDVMMPGLTYRGDEYSVRQLASLLLDNAVKYAAPGGAIRFSLEKAKRGVVIRCENPCESWETLETDKLFDRFYRADASRSGEATGFGIGLSVARSIAEGHRGWITAEAAEGRVVFTACLR